TPDDLLKFDWCIDISEGVTATNTIESPDMKVWQRKYQLVTLKEKFKKLEYLRNKSRLRLISTGIFCILGLGIGILLFKIEDYESGLNIKGVISTSIFGSGSVGEFYEYIVITLISFSCACLWGIIATYFCFEYIIPLIEEEVENKDIENNIASECL
ncbi:2844_t:CDS:2, partial [Scutellospora calospora]